MPCNPVLVDVTEMHASGTDIYGERGRGSGGGGGGRGRGEGGGEGGRVGGGAGGGRGGGESGRGGGRGEGGGGGGGEGGGRVGMPYQVHICAFYNNKVHSYTSPLSNPRSATADGKIIIILLFTYLSSLRNHVQQVFHMPHILPLGYSVPEALLDVTAALLLKINKITIGQMLHVQLHSLCSQKEKPAHCGNYSKESICHATLF